MLIESSQCKLLFNDPIQSESAGILLRSRLQSSARRMGFSDIQRENMALVASETVSNLIKHAGGKGMLQIWQQPDNFLDLFSFDYGPGVHDLPLAQQDGYSTTHTLGKGLGSMRRLSDKFGIYSQRARGTNKNRWHGTAVWCRFHVDGRQPETTSARQPFQIGLYSRALSNDRYNGDHIYLRDTGDKLRLLHLDGLGHGERAQLATDNLGSYLVTPETVEAVIASVDRQLRAGGRGAVAVCCDIDITQRSTHWTGVGDMGMHLCQHNEVEHYTFAPGVLGKEHKAPLTAKFQINDPFTLISTSDGIRRGWSEEAFPGLFNQHPQLISYVLGNSMGRIADDQSLCAVLINGYDH